MVGIFVSVVDIAFADVQVSFYKSGATALIWGSTAFIDVAFEFEVCCNCRG